VLDPAGNLVDVLVCSAAPITESGRLVRVIARLATSLGDARLVERARSAVTREDLVALLAPVADGAGEAALPARTLFALLDSGDAGLTRAEADRRLAACGPNQLQRVARRPLVLRLAEQFSTFFAVLLWIGGAFAFLARMPELGWAIFAVIVVNGVFSFLQEYRAERAIAALEELLPEEVAVVREGRESRARVADLVPGDVVRLVEGDQVPADGPLLGASGLRLDQSALTGESRPIFKRAEPSEAARGVARHERRELVFAGTGVVAGEATFLVVATGMATEIGAIARLTQTVREQASPLQREMARVTRVVTALAVAFGVSFFTLGVLTGRMPMGEGFVFALGVIVANVPEGLLPTLTLALAMGAQRMARQKSVMKRLSSVETLGATTVICTDKTGTLTRNEMAVRFVWTSGATVALDGGGALEEAIRDVLEAGVLASVATPERGDPTEVALVRAAVARGVDPEHVRAACPIVAPYPFDSFRKRMSLVRSRGTQSHAYVKGAPRSTLALCDRIRWANQTLPLTDGSRATVLAAHDRLASEGLRLLAVAVRPVPAGAVPAAAEEIEQGLILLGLVALWDPPRPEVPEAIALCARAGIRVVMVTGDDGLTARAIARRVGLHVGKVVTGEELDHLGADGLRAMLVDPGVLFARTSPAHKLAIVSALRERGEVVGVTGDGVNDAPALRAADIGVAMGRRGSAVAKEAADMVVTDDNFASIVTAVREGRALYANMGKFVTYIFASNVPELVPFLAFVFLRIPLPLTVMQILAVDLGTDLVPALALGAEAPEADIMDRPPRGRDARLLGPARLLHAYAFLGTVEAGLSLFAFFWTYWLAGWRPGMPMATEGPLYLRATTMTLAGIVAAQVGNVFACRTDRHSVFATGLFANRFVLAGVAVEIGILVALILLPPLARLFGLAPLSVPEWSVLLAFPFVMLACEEARKLARSRLIRDRRAPP
jgi:calcium-translocating P-type ATPase